MSSRRDNRVAAVQFLFVWSFQPEDDLADSLHRFFENQPVSEDGSAPAIAHPRTYYAFAEELVNGVISHLEQIDAVIGKYAQNWDFKRIARIDLAILRVAIFEMMFRNDIPPIVSINEAIDLSKEFSIPDAKRFINGILDKFKYTLDRPHRQAME